MTRAALTGAASNSSRIVGRWANFNEFSIDEIAAFVTGAHPRAALNC